MFLPCIAVPPPIECFTVGGLLPLIFSLCIRNLLGILVFFPWTNSVQGYWGHWMSLRRSSIPTVGLTLEVSKCCVWGWVWTPLSPFFFTIIVLGGARRWVGYPWSANLRTACLISSHRCINVSRKPSLRYWLRGRVTNMCMTGMCPNFLYIGRGLPPSICCGQG